MCRFADRGRINAWDRSRCGAGLQGYIADAVTYLAEAGEVTGEVVHLDGGAHASRW